MAVTNEPKTSQASASSPSQSQEIATSHAQESSSILTSAASTEPCSSESSNLAAAIDTSLNISVSHEVRTKNLAGPDDITPIGAEFDFDDQITKLKGYTFPKTGNSKDQRSFQLQWLQRYKWIEYSKKGDAVFCNTCRQFGKDIQQDKTFTLKGYSNWKQAPTANRGFDRHNKSKEHETAFANQLEKRSRIASCTSVSELVNASVLEKRRYYCKSIIDTIVFLAGKRLALRGDWDPNEHEEKGLFNSLFEFAMQKDPRLVEVQKSMPLNITYKSPDIQNELIGILAKILRASIVKEIVESDCGYYTILFDGTNF